MRQTFGKLIRELRQERGLSASALAQRSGLCDQTIYSLENLNRQPTLDTARRLAAVLGVTLEHLASRLPPVDLPPPEPGPARARPRKEVSNDFEARNVHPIAKLPATPASPPAGAPVQPKKPRRRSQKRG